MEIHHRKYLLSYHKQSFFGFWKSILDNPPCKPPNSARNKQFSYELEPIYNGTKHELYLHLIGTPSDLEGVEVQLSKFKIARLEPPGSPDQIVLITDSHPDHGAVHMFKEFCRAKRFRIKGKEIHREGQIIKSYRSYR